MKIFETEQEVINGKLIINVPELYEGRKVIVSISEAADDNEKDNWAYLTGAERLKILEQFKGTAKYPDTETNKYDVYNQ